MRFDKYLIESTGKNIIIVDVQEEYRSHIHFDMGNFCDFINKGKKILCLYNGESLGFGSKETEIIDFYMDNGLDPDKFDDFKFIDKGYAFFRAWMDNGVDEDDIIKVLKYMKRKNINDSRDIDENEWEKHFSNIDAPPDDPLFFPDVEENILRKFAGSYLVGGGKTECLKEIEILMKTYNIRYNLFREFIY